MHISYAQNLEDYHLDLVFAGQPNGTYVDVGGGHPVADNVSFWFYERGWRGLVVEPQLRLAEMYPFVRPRDICISALVGKFEGEAEFYQFDRLHGLSTMEPKFAEGGAKHGDHYEVLRRPITTLARLCHEHAVSEIDFLKIDVEGAEGDVLAGNDWSRYRPKLVVAEAIVLETGQPSWDKWEPYLLAQGYEFALFDTLNRFYVASEQKEILASVPRERAAWNAATHMYEIGKAPDNAAHPDHALATELSRAFWSQLPRMDGEFLSSLLANHQNMSPAARDELAVELRMERSKAALARIACAYDGGQIDPAQS